MTIAAIQTEYDGNRFRSRLEARWAVFFNHLGIEWQFEPQGYQVGDGRGAYRNYLPDFYLPALEVWAEVRGTSGDWNLWHDFAKRVAPHSQKFIVLGQIPKESGGWLHTRAMTSESGWGYAYWDDGTLHLLGNYEPPWPPTVDGHRNRNYGSDRVDEAYRAARTARFEHGETPATPSSPPPIPPRLARKRTAYELIASDPGGWTRRQLATHLGGSDSEAWAAISELLFPVWDVDYDTATALASLGSVLR